MEQNLKSLLKKAHEKGLRYKTIGFYTYLLLHQRGGIAEIPHTMMKDDSGLSKAELHRLKEELVDHGLILYTRGTRSYPSRYEILGWIEPTVDQGIEKATITNHPIPEVVKENKKEENQEKTQDNYQDILGIMDLGDSMYEDEDDDDIPEEYL